MTRKIKTHASLFDVIGFQVPWVNGPNTPYNDAYRTIHSAFTGLVDHVNGGFRGRMEEERHTGVGSFKVGKSDQVRVLSFV